MTFVNQMSMKKLTLQTFRKKRKVTVCQLYSRMLPGPERIRESALVKEPICDPPDGTVKTLVDLIERGRKVSNNGPFLGKQTKMGTVEWQSYSTVIETAKLIGSALINLGISSGQESKIAVLGLNSVEYAIIGHAVNLYSMVLVPLYHNYSFQELQKIVNKCKVKVVFSDSLDMAHKFTEQKDKTPLFHTWSDLLEEGEQHPQDLQLPSPHDIYMICHTSGTTGTPKGAQISHRALLTTMSGPFLQWFTPEHDLTLTSHDIYLSFLSLAHVYEQIMQCIMTFAGARIAFYCGEIFRLNSDLQTFQPTVVAFVPRILTKLKQQIDKNLTSKNKLTQKLFKLGFDRKKKDLINGVLNYHTIWDRLLFKPIHKTMGGRLRLIITGGAPIAEELKQFSQIVYGCPVLEGYGQTECAAAGTLTLPGDTSTGHVGGPSPWAQVKLISVPEMRYKAEDDIGEVCFRGEGVMTGYLDEVELTNLTLDQLGWLHTGDIGRWRENGALEIMDRKNNLFKLAQGDFVSPEKVEQVYSKASFVTQLFVHAKPTQSHLIAIIVVDTDNLMDTFAEIIDKMDRENEVDLILQDPEVRKAALTHLRDLGQQNDLNQLEQIQNLHLIREEFTLESELLTPTLKLKRKQLTDKFATIIDQLYLEKLV